MPVSSLVQQQEFPQLPPHEGTWSASIRTAHAHLENTYNHAIHVLLADGADPTRIAFHIDRITSEALPIVLELASESQHAEGIGLPGEWLENIAELLGNAVSDLQQLCNTLNRR